MLDVEQSSGFIQILHLLNGGEYKCIDIARSGPGLPIFIEVPDTIQHRRRASVSIIPFQ